MNLDDYETLLHHFLLPDNPDFAGFVRANPRAYEPTPSQVITPTTSKVTDLDPGWWNETVFYEIFVRSFKDSDGDGIGDFNGITEMLDYLNDGDPATSDDLGITGIWLMPSTESPSYHGYDVVDYFNVEKDYGTKEDFLRLVEEAHKRGIQVIVDLVLNHTSTENPWFKASDSGDPEYRDWYIWSEDNPGYLGPWGEQVWYRGAGWILLCGFLVWYAGSQFNKSRGHGRNL